MEGKAVVGVAERGEFGLGFEEGEGFLGCGEFGQLVLRRFVLGGEGMTYSVPLDKPRGWRISRLGRRRSSRLKVWDVSRSCERKTRSSGEREGQSRLEAFMTMPRMVALTWGQGVFTW